MHGKHPVANLSTTLCNIHGTFSRSASQSKGIHSLLLGSGHPYFRISK